MALMKWELRGYADTIAELCNKHNNEVENESRTIRFDDLIIDVNSRDEEVDYVAIPIFEAPERMEAHIPPHKVSVLLPVDTFAEELNDRAVRGDDITSYHIPNE
jgi:hypothetical protein